MFLKGKCVVIMINVGGLGVFIVDVIDRKGFKLVNFEEKIIEEFCFFFLLMVVVKNLVDMIVFVCGEDYYRIVKFFFWDLNVDMFIVICVVLIFVGMMLIEYVEGVIKVVKEVNNGKFVFGFFMVGYVSEKVKEFFEVNGILSYERLEDVVVGVYVFV